MNSGLILSPGLLLDSSPLRGCFEGPRCSWVGRVFTYQFRDLTNCFVLILEFSVKRKFIRSNLRNSAPSMARISFYILGLRPPDSAVFLPDSCWQSCYIWPSPLLVWSYNISRNILSLSSSTSLVATPYSVLPHHATFQITFHLVILSPFQLPLTWSLPPTP